MNALEKLKLTGRLKAAVDMRNVEKNPLKKLKAAKEVQDLRWQLGLIGGVAKVPDNKLDESSLRPLNVPENATAKEVRKALEDYLKQLQGKTIAPKVRPSQIAAVRTILDEELDAIWANRKPAKEALDSAAQRANAALNRPRKKRRN